jgi:DNA invertase Pin-like site-specific DNA recombinase
VSDLHPKAAFGPLRTGAVKFAELHHLEQISSMILRVAIYARFSSELQREASIEDQTRVCMAYVNREGWSLIQTYTDYAISGATALRPGYQALLADARAGRFDVIIAESLDRFSRDQEHIAAFYK